MGWKDEQRARDEALADELQRVHDAIRDLTPPVVSKPLAEPAGRDPSRVAGLALSLRLCRDYESGSTLLGMLKPVPREIEHGGERLQVRGGRHGLEVLCPCAIGSRGSGEIVVHHVRTVLEPCAHGCGRWFVGDESGVWAVMLPAQELSDAA
jgi:hypothetical protein